VVNRREDSKPAHFFLALAADCETFFSARRLARTVL
jgi:hypothetical protein